MAAEGGTIDVPKRVEEGAPRLGAGAAAGVPALPADVAACLLLLMPMLLQPPCHTLHEQIRCLWTLNQPFADLLG